MKASALASLSFAKPLYQHRSVCVLGGAPAIATFLKEHGARSVSVSDAAGLQALAKKSIDLFFCVLPDSDWSDETWISLIDARADNGVVVVQTLGDSLGWTQALSKRFASVERAELVTGDAAWVGPSGAVAATVSLEDTPHAGALFVCGDRPQRLALGSVCIAANKTTPPSEAALEQSLSGDISASLDEDRLRELESRLQQTMEDLLQAQLIAAQALAERDTLKRQMERQTPADGASLLALRDEIEAIERLVKRGH